MAARRSSGTLRCLLGGLALLASAHLHAQSPDLLGRARLLVEQGHAQAAYDLLLPHQEAQAGNPDYDYVLGIAALDAGYLTQAVFALERVLAMQPDDAQARAEIARAYLELGEVDNARREFEAVKLTAPPAEVMATIDRYLARIDGVLGPVDATRLSGYLSLTLGRDTNVNAAQDERLLDVPLFTLLGVGPATLNNAAIARADYFAQVAAGFSIAHRIGPSLALLANGAVQQRWNESESRFDISDGRADLGLTWRRGLDSYTVALQGDRFFVDDDRFRDAYGVAAQWRRTLDASTQLTTYGQATGLSYPGQEIRNANRYTVGVNLARALGGPYSATLSIGGYGGVEAERASGVEHLGHRFFGGSAFAQLRVRPDVWLFAGAQLENRDYGGLDPFFLVRREDAYYNLRGGATWRFAPSWSLTPQIAYTRNDSTVALNDYDRLVLSLMLRRDLP